MPKVLVTCQECGKTCRVLQSQIKWQRGKYCSKKCLVKSRIGEKNHNWKPKIKRICQECQREFEVHPYRTKDNKGGKYCSRACSDTARSKIYVGENHPGYKGRFPIICQTCKKTFYVTQSRASVAKYCSLECFSNRNKT